MLFITLPNVECDKWLIDPNHKFEAKINFEPVLLRYEKDSGGHYLCWDDQRRKIIHVLPSSVEGCTNFICED